MFQQQTHMVAVTLLPHPHGAKSAQLGRSLRVMCVMPEQFCGWWLGAKQQRTHKTTHEVCKVTVTAKLLENCATFETSGTEMIEYD